MIKAGSREPGVGSRRLGAAALSGLLLVAATLLAQGPLQADLKAQLVTQVEAVAAGLQGVVGYRLVDLTTGATVASRLDAEPFPTASTIKLAILYEMFMQAEAGTLPLDTPAPLNRAQVVGGSGVLQFLHAPVLSMRDVAALMIILSDNTATNVVIDAVGMPKVNARMAALGLADIQLRRKMMDSAAVKRGDENVASPGSLARIAELLWKGEGLKAGSREAARAILHEVPGQIRSAVPAEVPVASKTGELDGVRAEAAVVELPGRPFALSVMTTYLAHDADGDRAIHDIAAAAFSYFDRLATGGAYGRKQP
jgi:beta-lactamase class A